MAVSDCPSDVLTKVFTDKNYAEMSLAEVRLSGGHLGSYEPTSLRFVSQNVLDDNQLF